MRVTKIYCDHCGKEIIAFSGYVNDEIVIVGARKKCDLCDGCADDLVKLVEDFCTNSTVMKGA